MPRVRIPTEFVLALRPTGGKRDLKQLRKLLFTNWLSPFLRRHIKHAPRTSHTNALGTTEYMVESDLARKPDGDRIVYRLVLKRGDACGLSRAAAHHWLELALAAKIAEDKYFANWIAAFGYQLASPPPPPAELLARPWPVPLVEVAPPRKVLIGAVAGAPDRIIADEGVGPQRVAELSPDDRKRVAQAAASGMCACFLCVKLRERYGAKKPTKPKAATAKPAKPKTTAAKPARSRTASLNGATPKITKTKRATRRAP